MSRRDDCRCELRTLAETAPDVRWIMQENLKKKRIATLQINVPRS